MFRLPALLALLACAAPVAAQPSEEDAVRATAAQLFDSWREADAAKGDAILHPLFRLATRHDNFAANYRFHIGGRLTHCGIVALTLYRSDGRWRIVDFADTHHWAQPGEPGGCAAPAAP